jgi:hypothetical protein
MSGTVNIEEIRRVIKNRSNIKDKLLRPARYPVKMFWKLNEERRITKSNRIPFPKDQKINEHF